MTEFEVMAKDYIKLNFLSEVVTQKTVDFKLFLESDGAEKDFLDIRADQSVYRFNNFNVSEDAVNNCITFRPVVIGCYSYFRICSSGIVKLEIIKNGTTVTAKSFDFSGDNNKIIFDPQGTKKYIMRIEGGQPSQAADIRMGTVNQPELQPETVNPGMDEIRQPEFQPQTVNTRMGEIRQPELQPETVNMQMDEIRQPELQPQTVNTGVGEAQPTVPMQSSLSQMEIKPAQPSLNKLRNEFNKDYSRYQTEAEEIRSRYTIDKEILSMYGDKDIVSVEELFRQAEDIISRIEDQIRDFVEAQQRKTAEIENELKIGKKQ